MKFLEFTFILLLWIFAGKAIADCQYWDGTAPFCDGSCPGNCLTIATSNSGNGASCWTGSKALCNCCPGPGPCTPTETETGCYGIVLICKNVELIFGSGGQQSITCSTYVCGLCLGFSFFLEAEETVPSTPRGVLSINSTHRDVIVRGYNTTEEEIEDVLVSNFGRKLSPDEMKNVTVLKIAQPDISLIRGNEGCPRESVSMLQGRFKVQSPAPYYK
jgi:hypothetical protein